MVVVPVNQALGATSSEMKDNQECVCGQAKTGTQMENRAHQVCVCSYLWPLRLKIPLFFFFLFCPDLHLGKTRSAQR